jgi:hypothetical protein
MDMEKNVTSSVVIGKNELFGSGGCEAKGSLEATIL